MLPWEVDALRDSLLSHQRLCHWRLLEKTINFLWQLTSSLVEMEFCSVSGVIGCYWSRYGARNAKLASFSS